MVPDVGTRVGLFFVGIVWACGTMVGKAAEGVLSETVGAGASGGASHCNPSQLDSENAQSSQATTSSAQLSQPHDAMAEHDLDSNVVHDIDSFSPKRASIESATH